MSGRICVGLLGALLLGGGAVACFVWKDAAPRPVTSPFHALPTSDPAKVELSEVVVTRLGPQTVRCDFQYRFVDGKPAAPNWYCCLAEFPGCPGSYRRPIESKDLQAEG